MRSKYSKNQTHDEESKTPNDSGVKRSKRSNKKKYNSKDIGDDRQQKYDKGRKDTKVTLNDPDWTFPNPEIAEQVSQLSFQNFQGYGTINSYKVPTILKIGLMPCPGITSPAKYKAPGIASIAGNTSSQISLSDIDPGRTGANVAATKLYSLLSSFTGRTSNYQPNDVLMMLLAIASFTEVSEFVRRVFGVALTFNPRNRVLAKDLIASMGYEPDDFFANMSIYRMQFNTVIARINQIPLLDNVGFIKKSRDIFQYLYTDANTNMAQYFYYYPACAWVLNESAYTGGTALDSYNVFGSTSLTLTPSTLNKMSLTLTLMKDMVDALLTSTTLNLIYADLLNMSNKVKTPTWTFDYLAENYTVLPIYNENACLQLHNLDIMGTPILFANAGVTPDSNGMWQGYTNGNDVMSDANTGDILYNPMFYGTGNYATSSRKIVDMPTDNPDVKMRVEALRYSGLRSGFVKQNGTSYYFVSPALPDHYASVAHLYDVLEYTSNNTLDPGCILELSSNVKHYTSWTGTNETFRLKSTQISCAPLLLSMGNYSTDTETVTGNLEFYTTIDYEYIKRVNDFAFQFLFDFRNS